MTDYSELVKALRDEDNCNILDYIDDAAAAIEDLQAQLPKRGKWIVNGANRIDCSVCGHSICFASVLSKGSLTGYNYCPRCGAKMTGEQNVE